MSNKKATVFVRLKDGVLDPQGITIQKAILNMGYDQVASVRSGRFFELDIDADGEQGEKNIEEICSKLLSNPVIENYTVEYEK